MLPTITIEGNLTADPEMRFTPTGKPLAEFRIAATRRKRNVQGEWYDDKSIFLRVTVWDQLAENVANSLHKGDSVIVVGQLYQDEWQDQQGQRRTEVKMEGRNVGPSLLRAEANVRKINRQPAQAQPAADPWAAPEPVNTDAIIRTEQERATPADIWTRGPENPPF